MNADAYLKGLALKYPHIEFASDHARIYDDFVGGLMHSPVIEHPREYLGQTAVRIVCSQHPFSVEEGIADPKACGRRQREYTAEWVDFLNKEKLPVKEMDVCSAVDQKVFDALCTQETLESLRIKQLKCKRIDGIVKLKNLKKLYIGCASALDDISPAAKLTGLETLILCETKKITDYSALGALKNLKVLGICGSRTSVSSVIKVKDLDFLSELPAPEYVDLIDVRIINAR
jgi:hypothetical protein